MMVELLQVVSVLVILTYNKYHQETWESRKQLEDCLFQKKDVNGDLFDYASQEPRWLAHYCAKPSDGLRHPLIDEVTMYNEGKADFHQMVADMANISRKEAKTVNLGIMYGMVGGKISRHTSYHRR